MKALFKVLFFSIALPALPLIFTQCEKEGYDVIYEISDEEKFIFDIGDQLKYSCSDGSIDTFFISNVSSYTKTWITSTGGDLCMINCGDISYLLECNEIIIKTDNDRWNLYLNIDSIYTPCYKIEFIPTALAFTGIKLRSHIKKGCNEDSMYYVTEPIPQVMGHSTTRIISDTIFNNIGYYNIYSFKGGKNYRIFWNLKYGIIRFEGKNESSELYWDLVVHD